MDQLICASLSHTQYYWYEVRMLKVPAVICGDYTVHTYIHRHRFSLSMEMCRLTRDGTAEPVSRDQILRRERGQGNIHFPCSADHEQDWQPYPVDPYPYCSNPELFLSKYIYYT